MIRQSQLRRAGFCALAVATIGALLGVFAPPAAAGPADGVLDLLPVPVSVAVREGRFRVDENLTIAPAESLVHASRGDVRHGVTGRAVRAAARFMSRLSGRTGLFIKQDHLVPRAASAEARIRYSHQAPGGLGPNEDESYALTVEPDGIRLEAPTDLGVIRGFETLLQLVSADERGYYFPCVDIQDRPRFTWRGLLIDAGRHFQPVEVIKRNLDAMSSVKMNVLHWHLTEDQGFRVESKVFPKLHELGSDGLFYTQDQIKDIIAYAADRGVRVMPEFDLPGHATSWFVAYPELASAPGSYAIERRFGVFGPAFDPSNEKVYAFLEAFLKEMAGLFPDPYLHIGGDEVEGHQWDANPAIQAFKRKHGLADNAALQAHFNARLLKILTKLRKKMVGWDEIFQPGLPKDIVIHSWRGRQALVEAAGKGYQGILSNGYYIDLAQTAEFHYRNDPLPEDSPLDGPARALVLGGEATMWSELVTPETIDSRIWPRTAAIAERLWSPASVRDVGDMYRRLAVLSVRLEETGALHLKNPGMLLRRLLGRPEIGPLETLAEAVEPLEGYKRHGQAGLTSLSPLTRFVDACAPESLAARDFRVSVERFLAERDKRLGERLRDTLARWRDNHPLVLPALASSPALREIEPLSLGLHRAASIGLEALAVLTAGEGRPEAWIEERSQALAEAARPAAQAELVVAAAVAQLVRACGGAAK